MSHDSGSLKQLDLIEVPHGWNTTNCNHNNTNLFAFVIR